MGEHFGKLLAVLHQMQGLCDFNAEHMQVTRLGGLINSVILVAVLGQKVVVRIPGEGTETYIDHEVEAYNAAAAEHTGVAPAVLWADARSGVMVTRALEEIEPRHQSERLARTRRGSVDKAAPL